MSIASKGPYQTTDEAIFVRGLQNKDEQVFAQMYQQFSPPMYSFILGRVKDTEIAENLLQDVFVKAWRYADQYDASKGKLFIWMYKICSNCCIDYLRSKQQRISSHTVYTSHLSDDLRHYVAAGLMPDRIGLHNMLAKLKADEKEVLELIYFKGFTQEEVAKMTNTPLGTIKTRCSRAIKKLRSFFEFNQLATVPAFVLA